jgi:hypothetical protein
VPRCLHGEGLAPRGTSFYGGGQRKKRTSIPSATESHEISIALEKGAETPRIDYPPISVHRFSKHCFESGVEEHHIDGVVVRVYN